MKVKKNIIFYVSSLFFGMFCACSNNIDKEIDIYSYLPELKGFDIIELRVKKIFGDPSYVKPYNIYLAFSVNSIEKDSILNVLKLKKKQDVDTVKLKKNSWLEEYKYYFTTKSINSTRYENINKIESQIDWWSNDFKEGDVQSAPYFDNDRIRNTVNFGEQNNGRVSCSVIDNVFYILIECWG